MATERLVLNTVTRAHTPIVEMIRRRTVRTPSAPRSPARRRPLVGAAAAVSGVGAAPRRGARRSDPSHPWGDVYRLASERAPVRRVGSGRGARQRGVARLHVPDVVHRVMEEVAT